MSKKLFPKIAKNYENLQSNDKFKKKAGKKLDKTKKKIDATNARIEETIKKYQDLVKYFGISEKETYYSQPESLFKLFTLFFEDVDNAIPTPEIKKKVFVPKHEFTAKV